MDHDIYIPDLEQMYEMKIGYGYRTSIINQLLIYMNLKRIIVTTQCRHFPKDDLIRYSTYIRYYHVMILTENVWIWKNMKKTIILFEILIYYKAR